MTERVEKKLQQIAKIEKRIVKWSKQCTEQEIIAVNECKDKTYGEWVRYCKEHNIGYSLTPADELRRAYKDLDEAKVQLEKIQKLEAKKNSEEEILNNMPEVIKEFMEKVIKGWNEYDMYWKMVYKREYSKGEGMEHYREFIMKYGHSALELMRTSDEEINKNNTKDAERLVLNLWNRVKEITGEIKDAGKLRVTQDNRGFAVINGVVKGVNGTAKVESIGAGGYNIQRWHIRTLVKEVA